MMLSLTRVWYQKSLNWLSILLLPLSWLFFLCVSIRRFLYRCGLLKSFKFHVSIIVVGNITVGGTGKTPFVMWLASMLRAEGFQPGIVSRGIGGKKHFAPHLIKASDKAEDVGDEALLLHQHTACPMVVCIDRAKAVQELLAQTNCNVVISDDGLQHYRLQRDVEIIMVDGERHFGNKQLLPAGPLRESVSRVQAADFVIVNGNSIANSHCSMMLEPHSFTAINSNKKMDVENISQFMPKVHAVAGIGHPEQFFKSLKKLGIEVIPHIFPDHYLYSAKDFEFNDKLPIVMTEKDAVKCRTFADEHYWFLAVQTKIDKRLEEKILTKIKAIQSLEVSDEKGFVIHSIDPALTEHHRTCSRDNAE